MSNLLSINEINDNSPWYFEDARWTDANAQGRWRYDWPSPQYPYVLGIKKDDLHAITQIQIRKWVETLLETVIYDQVDRSYRRYYGKDKTDWELSAMVYRHWLRFHFSNEEDALAFKLKFGEYITDVPEDPNKRS
jgi:hypothetical protein